MGGVWTYNSSPDDKYGNKFGKYRQLFQIVNNNKEEKQRRQRVKYNTIVRFRPLIFQRK